MGGSGALGVGNVSQNSYQRIIFSRPPIQRLFLILNPARLLSTLYGFNSASVPLITLMVLCIWLRANFPKTLKTSEKGKIEKLPVMAVQRKEGQRMGMGP